MSTISAGIHKAVNQAILTATRPEEGILPDLINGRPRVLLTWWCGLGSDTSIFDTERGDGDCRLVHEDHPFYALPPCLPPDLNYWQATPFWCFAAPQSDVISTDVPEEFTPPRWPTVAHGLIYPRFNSATVDFYCPLHGQHLDRLYLSDPRVVIDSRGFAMPHTMIHDPILRKQQPAGGDFFPVDQQVAFLREAGISQRPNPHHAPAHPVFCPA